MSARLLPFSISTTTRTCSKSWWDCLKKLISPYQTGPPIVCVRLSGMDIEVAGEEEDVGVVEVEGLGLVIRERIIRMIIGKRFIGGM